MVRNGETNVRVALLGPVQIEDRTGRLTEPAGVLAKSLIVALALSRGFALSAPSLVDELWGDNPPRQGRAALQTLVSRLRANAMEGILESTASGYALAVRPSATDLGLAASSMTIARELLHSGDYAEAAEQARQALDLWRGEPGADLADSPLGVELASRSDALRAELRRIHAEALLGAGDAESALAELELLVADSPLDEELQHQLLTAMNAAGRRNEAIRAFSEFRARVRDELGTNPGERLIRFNTELLRDEPVSGLPVRSAHVRIGLRTSPNDLVGRDADVERLVELVASSRLTTLLGPGGIGKTRLAQEVANRASCATDAVIVVELASVRSAEDVALAFASTLGIREARRARVQAGDPGSRVDLRTRILAALSERQTLLVVDNCEHIVDAAAGWVSDILDSTTNVHVLATSRAPLAIGAERVYQLGPLGSVGTGTPRDQDAGRGSRNAAILGEDILGEDILDEGIGAHGPAVELFVQRARAARPNVVLPRKTIIRLCRRLDGLPLAIELAAARTRSMSVDEIERRLENRFVLLTGGERTAPERHRTLHAVIDWSWNLLSGREQSLLRRLCRFPDGFSAEAAAILAGGDALDVTDDLDALVSQSLVSVTEDRRSGILRYRMLETVREFGELQLTVADESDLVRDRMFEWAAAFARDALLHMDGAAQLGYLRAVAAEQDNLVAVLRDALDAARPDVVVNVFGGLGYFWTLRSNHSEVLSFAHAIARATEGFEPDGDDVVPTAGVYTLLAGTLLYIDLRTSARLLSRLRRLRRVHSLNDARLEAMSSILLSFDSRHSRTGLLLDYCDDPNASVACIANLIVSGFHENAGELDAALASSKRSYELALQIDELWAQSSSAQAIAQLYSQMARPALALEWAERARAGLEELEATGDIQQLDWLIAVNSMSMGEFDHAKVVLEYFARADDLSSSFDFMDLRAIGFSGLAEIALAEGHTAQGLALYRQGVDVFAASPGSPMPPWFNIITAACIVARVRLEAAEASADAPAETDTPDRAEARAETDDLARKLRVRLIAASRLRPNFIDKPVLATGSFAIAAWALVRSILGVSGDPNGERSPLPVSDAIELLALTTRLSSRQDMPSLHRAPIEAMARDSFGPTVDETLQRVTKMNVDDATSRVLELLRAVGH